MKKQFDIFKDMNIKDMSESISEMTYSYINPETKLPTEVPAKHYKQILETVKEEFLAEELKRAYLNLIFTQLKNIKDENEKDFIQSLLCFDLGVNPKNMTIQQKIALDVTYVYWTEQRDKQKKKFHFLSEDIVEMFNDAMNDKELHARIIGSVEQEDEYEHEDELVLN